MMNKLEDQFVFNVNDAGRLVFGNQENYTFFKYGTQQRPTAFTAYG